MNINFQQPPRERERERERERVVWPARIFENRSVQKSIAIFLVAIFCFIYIAPLTANAGFFGCLIINILSGTSLPSIGFINKDNNYFGDNGGRCNVGKGPISGPIQDYLKETPHNLKGFLFKVKGNDIDLTKAHLINFFPAYPLPPFKTKIEKISHKIQSFDYSSEIKEVDNPFEVINTVDVSRSKSRESCSFWRCKKTTTNEYITYVLTAYGNIYRGYIRQEHTTKSSWLSGFVGAIFGIILAPFTFGTSLMITAAGGAIGMIAGEQLKQALTKESFSAGRLDYNLVYSPDYPSVDLKINSIDGDPLSMIVPNTNTTLSWTSKGVTDCKASGDWDGNKSISGEEELGKLPRGKESPGQGETYDFIISCRSDEGEEVSDKVSAKILQYPSCFFSANPSKIILPQISTLKWSCEYADSAEIEPKIGSVSPTAGSIEIRPSENTTYFLDASGLDGSKIYRATVEIGMPESPPPFEYRIKEVAP